MTIKHYLAIATVSLSLTATAFGQGNLDIDKLPARKARRQSIQSPRDAASGQATGIVSPRDPASGLPTGKRQHKPIAKRPGIMNNIGDASTNGVVAGQNSGGTITNQRRKRPSGITADDYWEQKRRTPRKRK
jgi:hypothetical protein